MISNEQYIEILLNSDENEIYNFDVITIIFHQNCKTFVLFEDFICEGLKSLHNALEKALHGKLQLDDVLKEKGIGYTFNNICFDMDSALDEDLEDVTSKYSVWSTTSKYSYETWVYNIGEKIYFEISPTYKWFHIDPKESEEYVEFTQFINNYKVLSIFSIEMNVAKRWLEESFNLIQQMQ